MGETLETSDSGVETASTLAPTSPESALPTVSTTPWATTPASRGRGHPAGLPGRCQPFRRLVRRSGPLASPGSACHRRRLPRAHAPPKLATSALRRRLAAISVLHQLAGFKENDLPTRTPEVKTVWAGIRRVHGVAPKKVRAARTKVINALVAQLGSKPIDIRDRALLLIGFAGALRRSELVGLDVADITEDDEGLRLLLRRSKTDQEGETKTLGLPYGSNPSTCPVRAWRAWRAIAGLEDGPAFRAITRHGKIAATRLSDRAIANMIARRALSAGLDGHFAGHSLRAGFATEGYAQGTPELAMMRHGRWRSPAVMRGYIEEGGIWTDNAAARLGL